MSRVYLTQLRTPSASPPPFLSHYQHCPIRPPVVPESRTPPTSYPNVAHRAPTSNPRPPIVITTPPQTTRFDSHEVYSRHGDGDHYRRPSGHSRSSSNASYSSSHHSRSSRSSSATSSQRSLSPPLTRSASPSSCSSRSSSTSGKSVRFAEKNEYSAAPAVKAERLVEYVSSRGASYHASERRGREPADSAMEWGYMGMNSLVVEKARHGGREGRRRSYTVSDDLEARRERCW